MLTRAQRELVAQAYGLGMAKGVNHVLDLIEEGVAAEDLQWRAMQRVTRTRKQHRAGLAAEERFEALQQQPRGPQLFLVNGKARPL
jgi:hypothetical protein